MSVLDVFKQDAFSVISMTDAINKRPFIPGRAGAVAGWAEQGVATLTVMIEEQSGYLALVNPTPRGGPGSAYAKVGRTARVLSIPHYQIDDGINADEVQGVRAFGQESQVQTVMSVVNSRMASHVQEKLDPTLEYQRIGAIKGIILNADGSTLYNLFTEFGVGVPDTVYFNLAAADDGALRNTCAQVARTLAGTLAGIPFSGIYALCGDEFFDALIANPEVRATYLNQQDASQLRTGVPVYGQFNFGGITWENYRGGTGLDPFIAADSCQLFPTGVPGLFRTIYGPADYLETVNTIGLPRYARQWEMHNGKGIHLEVQMNALNYCTRPNVLIPGSLEASA